jgi:ribosomal protein S18 acetylase RimI-like enzyme
VTAARVRPARREDVPFLAWVMLAASRSHLPRGAWDLTIDGSDDVRLAVLERMARHEPPTFCHHVRFLVAEQDGVPAAALSGYDPAAVTDAGVAVDEAMRALGFDDAAIAAGNGRFAPFLTCVPEQRPGTWIVEWVATRPEFRRRGLVDTLLEAILAAGRAEGHRTAQVSVLIGNAPAEAAYRKAGFTLERERRHPAFEAAMGCPGIAQLRRPL